MKQLERLLFLQGNRCFLCHHPIAPGEASVEHLVATSNGGAKDDENCIVCCKAANAALGSLSIKAKFQAVLSHRGALSCPHVPHAEPQPTSAQPPSELAERIKQVVVDLQKRGSARPRRLSTLKNTINALFKMQLLEADLNLLVDSLAAMGHVVVSDEKVTYALPPRDA
ncbi:MAG: hypothetical protein JNL19_06310 [Burkholderiales bacterium]|nr:hypothetical protein [Burkholderiales bacterium]